MTSELHVQETYKKVSNKKEDTRNDEKEQDTEMEQQKQVKSNKEVQKLGSNTGNMGQSVAQTRNSDTQAAAPTGKTHSGSISSASGGVPQVDRFYTLEEIKRNKSLASNDTKEAYLSDEEFESIFGMSKVDFYNLRPWKQKQLKKSKGIF